MTDLAIGLWSMPLLLGLIALRVPVGLSLFVVGFGGLTLLTGSTHMVLARLKTEVYTTFSNYSLSIVPMFLLMGAFAARGGLSAALFRAAQAFLGHRRGGVALASIGACAGFGAICGSSLATAATMGRVALPELKRAGYAGGFASATLAAGGTLGILIPPSVVLVIYAVLAQQNIAKLFAAALVPGLLAVAGYMLAVAVYVRRNPDSAGTCARVGWADRLRALAMVWPVLLIFAVVVGGIYGGIFTPTEGAAIGALATGLLAWARGGLGWGALADSLTETARTTAMIFFIVLGAAIYNGFLAFTRLPQELSAWVVDLGLAPVMVLCLILVIYLVLGCFMDSLSMILLTIPIFYPMLITLDFGMPQDDLLIWFGILALIVVEVGLITPPVGMNLFVIGAMDRSTPVTATYGAVIYYVGADLLRVVLLVAFPALTLWLVPG